MEKQGVDLDKEIGIQKDEQDSRLKLAVNSIY